MSESLDDGVVTIRSSAVREEIVRQLYGRELVRPSEILGEVQARTDTSKANFYQNLDALEGSIVEKLEGEGRATLYTLTDFGAEVAEKLGLDGHGAPAGPPGESADGTADPPEGVADEPRGVPRTKDEARELLAESPLSLEEIEDVLEEVRQVRQWTGE